MRNVTWLVFSLSDHEVLEFPYDKLMVATLAARMAGHSVVPLIDSNTAHERALLKLSTGWELSRVS